MFFSYFFYASYCTIGDNDHCIYCSFLVVFYEHMCTLSELQCWITLPSTLVAIKFFKKLPVIGVVGIKYIMHNDTCMHVHFDLYSVVNAIQMYIHTSALLILPAV